MDVDGGNIIYGGSFCPKSTTVILMMMMAACVGNHHHHNHHLHKWRPCVSRDGRSSSNSGCFPALQRVTAMVENTWEQGVLILESSE